MTSTIQPNFNAGEISPSLYGRVDMDKYRAGLRTLQNFIVQPQGGVQNRPGLRHIGEALHEDARLIPFQFSTVQGYVLEFGNRVMRILRNGELVIDPGTGQIAEIPTPYDLTQARELRFTQSADVMFLTHPDVTPYTLTRTDHHLWSFDAMVFAAPTPAPATVTASPVPANAESYTYYVEALFPATGGGDYDYSDPSLPVVVTGRNPWAGTITLSWSAVTGPPAVAGYAIWKKTGAGAYANVAVVSPAQLTWTDTNTPAIPYVQDTAQAVTGPEITAAVWQDASAREYNYAVSAILEEGETLATVSTVQPEIEYPWPAGESVVISWPPVTGAKGYVIYKNSRGQWGTIGATDEEAPIVAPGLAQFIDDNIEPDPSIGSRKPPIADLTTAGDHPAAVAIYGQRLIFARSDNKPATVWTTRTGDLSDMSSSDPIRSDDPIVATPATGKPYDEILHLVPLDALLLFSASAEIAMSGGSSALATDTVQFDIQGYDGCANLPEPLVAGNAVLFVQRGNRTVRELVYSFDRAGYDSTDLSILSQHLLEASSVETWAFQQLPYKVVWAVRNDGVALTMTYLREHAVIAWARQSTDGEFKEVSSINDGVRDRVTFIVKRGGVAYLEELSLREEEVHLDAHLTYSGAATDTFGGLSHLEGRTVKAVGDGYVYPDLTVSGGQVTLPEDVSECAIGLAYDCDMETLDLDVSDQLGSTQGRRQAVFDVVIRVQNTAGLQIGPTEDELENVPWRQFEGYDQEANRITGDISATAIKPAFRRSARVYLRQKEPLPCTILSIMPEVIVGG